MDILELLKDRHDIQTFAEGQNVFEVGDPASVMYVVMSGQVDIVVHEKIIDTVEPSGIVGEMALIDSRPRSATAIAKTECQVVPINRALFAKLIQSEPDFAIQVMRIMVERLRYMNALV